jgi:heme A synthase
MNVPSEPASPAVARWSIVTAVIVFAQLLLGGLVRHQQDSILGPRGHLLGAFLVVGAVVWLLKLMRESETSSQFKVQRISLMILLALQLWLGVESWLARFFVATAANQQAIMPMPTHAEWIRTAHYLVGTLIFATSVTVVLIANRKPVAVVEAVTERPRQLEGAL